MNSMIYADESLHQFLEKCKKEKWYKNTIFVIVADHGHTTPDNNDPNHGSYFHIPLLFFGDALKPEFHGKKLDVVGSARFQSNLAGAGGPTLSIGKYSSFNFYEANLNGTGITTTSVSHGATGSISCNSGYVGGPVSYNCNNGNPNQSG